MNTNGPARHYETLTPRERLPLIMAASARGDEAEAQRLAHSAPLVSLRVPDYFGLAMAIREVAELHLLESLGLAAMYERCLAMADLSETGRGERLINSAMLLGYQFNIWLAGWRQFGRELHFDAEILWSFLPGYEVIQRTEERTKAVAFTVEEARAYLERNGKTGEIITAGYVAADLRRFLEVRAAWWG
jgi:hypothetical protein